MVKNGFNLRFRGWVSFEGMDSLLAIFNLEMFLNAYLST